MRIAFNLEYQTNFGEELELNILTDGKTEQHKMTTLDGYHWLCELSKAVKTKTHIDYFYSVMRGDEQTRCEWLTEPHRLEFVATKGARYTVYDHWIDIPEDSYLYSSAFTECVAARERHMSEETAYGKTIRLKVRAPQLRWNERLAVIGGGEALGTEVPRVRLKRRTGSTKARRCKTITYSTFSFYKTKVFLSKFSHMSPPMQI